MSASNHMGQRGNSLCPNSSRIGNQPFRSPALSFAFSFSKNGIEFLPPSRNLLRVGHGDPLDDGCPLRAGFGGAHVGFVVVVDSFRISLVRRSDWCLADPDTAVIVAVTLQALRWEGPIRRLGGYWAVPPKYVGW